MNAPRVVDLHSVDLKLELATLMRSSEAGYARDHRNGSAFGLSEDRRRLDAFTLGMLDGLGQALGERPEIVPLLVYLHALLELGPGAKARSRWAELLALPDSSDLRSYVAGGRGLVLRILADREIRPGLYAELLEQELQQR